ncbi:hypothetical protein RHGRI_034247 [Rhododendron griersonianum]|uniref:T-complex protein 1 subunit epsilon n=1 Tax=Rhododendron griersonianum TaxID=479676 RepID=A0AAV6I2Q5_9ERIC|nr:hypothetical protein RHGRI_034247 [Rhododendron griersonianum]
MTVEHLERITTKFEFSAANVDPLVQTCMTTLSSKIVNSCKCSLAEIAVNSVVAVADLKRRDVNLELIKVEGKVGGKLEDTELIKGIIVDKNMSHPQMPKHIDDAKIAILTCPFEPPKPKHKVDIDTVEKFQNLHEQEQKYFGSKTPKNERKNERGDLGRLGLANSVPQLPSSSNVSVVNNGVSSDTDSEVGLLEVLEGVVSSNKGGDALPQQLKAVDAVEVGASATNTHAVSSSINTSENLADALRAGFTPAENVHNPDILSAAAMAACSESEPVQVEDFTAVYCCFLLFTASRMAILHSLQLADAAPLCCCVLRGLERFGGRIVPRFQELTPEKLGKIDALGNNMMIEKTKQSIHDALCVAWNLIRNNSIVYGSGAAEISCSLAVEAAADRHPGIEQDAIRAFADVLDSIPMALAENSGLQLQPIETLSAVKSQQIKENNPCCGIDCNDVGTNDMREQTIFETLIGKQQQILLATQVVKMILKIDNVISPSEH